MTFLRAHLAPLLSACRALKRMGVEENQFVLMTAAAVLLISGAAWTRLLIAALTMLLIAAAGLLPMFLLAMGERAGESAGPVRRATFSNAAAGEGCRRSGGAVRSKKILTRW